MIKALLGILVACCGWMAYATVPCGMIDSEGYVYSFKNLTWYSTTKPYFADDGQHEFLVNVCEGVNEKECREHDGVPHNGFACMYNTSGSVPSFEGVLAAINDRPSPYWEIQQDGVKLSAFNGFYGSTPAKVTLELRCDESVKRPSQRIEVNANYQTATFKFWMKTSAACRHGKAAFAIEPSVLSRTASSPITVTLTSRPPVDVSLRCESPFLYPAGFFEQTFRGPEDGSPYTWVPSIKLVDNFDANRDSFPLICSLGGSNATLYQYPRSVNINVEPYQPKGHTSLSGGSIFIIILVVVGFCYILFGCLYRWRVVGSEPGMDSFPNIDMWRRIWQYAKDGVSFTMNGCKNTGTYTEVNDTH